MGVPLLYSTILDSKLCRSILPLSGLDMMLLGNYLKVCATLPFYSKWNSSARPTNCAESEPLSSSHLIFHHLPHAFSIPGTLAFSQCLLPCSCILHGELFPHGHMAYYCPAPSWKTSLPDCATCSYNKLLYYHVLHITASILHLYLVWLSFYSTILRAPWGQRWGWVLFTFISLVLRNLPDG